MKPCLWTDFLTELSPEDAIRLIAEAGFECVEFGLTHEKMHFENERLTSEEEDRRLAAIKATADEVGIDICQMHGRLFNLCLDDVEEDIAAAHRSIQRAAKLGVKWVVLHLGSAPGASASPSTEEWTRERNFEVFSAWLKTAESVGVGIAIENMIALGRVPFGASVSDLMWLVEKLDSPNVGICWDTGHAALSGIDQGAAIRAMGEHLVALHIADNDGQADRHWSPGRGIIDWKSVVEALHEIGYDGPFNLEVPGEGNVTPHSAKLSKMRYLRTLTDSLLNGDFPGR